MIYKRILFPTDPMMLNLRRGKQSISIEIHPEIKKKSIITSRFNRYADFWGRYIEFQNYAQKYFTFHTGTRDQIGYFDVREFPDDGSSFLSGLADTLKGSKAYIIDLRETPGGSLSTLLKFLGMFESTDVVLGSSIGREKTEELVVHPSKPRMEGPLIVLVDSQTASAAEVTARYLQINHKAVIMGDRSAGMVTIAQVFPGRVGGQFVVDFDTSVAVARLQLKNGEELEKKGVTPDIYCVPSAEDLAQTKDSCLEAAFTQAKKMINTP
jgi:C-terminal processing protease CtpA/Prc